MKVSRKLITFFFSMFLLLFAMPMTTKADELPPTSDGKEVVLTDFEILDAKTTYYDFESKVRRYDFYEDMIGAIHVKGIQYKLSYTVGGVAYESVGTIESDTNNEYGHIPEQPGIVGAYDGLNIFVSWKNYTTKEIDGEECYIVDLKGNALVCKCADKVVELPVKSGEPTPVEKIVIVENPWEDGIYGYKFLETIWNDKYDGLKIKITYSDGRDAEVIDCSEEGISNFNKKNGYNFNISQEPSGDGVPGEDYTSTTITVFYMGVKETFEVALIQNPIKDMKLTKNPKKMTYGLVDDLADIYGATLKIIYHDGTKETIKIKSHKTEIPVKNKYNESIKLNYYRGGHLWIGYLGKNLHINMPTKLSDLGRSKAITEGKSKIETLTAGSPTKLYALTAKKTGRYQIDFSGKRINIKTDEQKGSPYFTVYVLDADGYCKYDSEDATFEDNYGIIGLTKGEKYYFYVVVDEMDFLSGNGTSVLYKNEITSKVSYLGDLVEQNITASNITKKYSKDSFSVDAKADSGAELTYSSSNKKVATITKDGEVTLKGLGTTKITIKAPASGVYKAATKTITLKVTKGDANINVKETSYTKALGSKAFRLGATAETSLTYKSSNIKVVTVDKKGKVTIKGCGKATITITAGDEKYKKSTKKVTIQVTPKTAKIKSARSKKAGQLTLTWNKQKEAKGYVIEYSTDKNFKDSVKTVTIKKNGTVTKTLTGLKKKTTYYVRVKAYVEISGKRVYGETSKVKKVTTK